MEPQKKQALANAMSGKDWRYYAGPHVSGAVDRTGQLVDALMGVVGPQADVQDMRAYSGNTMDAINKGKMADALANFGMTGAAAASAFIPGGVGMVDDVSKGLTRLLKEGGDPVKVGELTADDLDIIQRLVPSDTGKMFRDADGSINIEQGLIDSIKELRPGDYERIVSRLPEIAASTDIRGDHVNPNRILKIIPHSEKPNYYDAMVLDVADSPGKIGIPTAFPSPQRYVNKLTKPEE